MANLYGICETANIDIVCAVDEDDVDTSHASEKRNDTPGHDLVLAEEAFISNVAAGQSESNNDYGEDGAPPAVEQSWVVCSSGAALRWRSIIDTARYYHCW
jgi:hypothetical protein